MVRTASVVMQRVGYGVLFAMVAPVATLVAVAVAVTSAGPVMTRMPRLLPNGRIEFVRAFRTASLYNGRLTLVGRALIGSHLATLPVLASRFASRAGALPLR